jgi:hypothetical protein
VDETIWAFVGVVVGAILTAGLSHWQSRLQRRWQVADFDRSQSAARDKEVRERADAKAEEILIELQMLEDLLLHGPILQSSVWPSDRQAFSEARAAISRLSKAALYLQKPLRRHVQLGVRVLPDVDQLSGEGWVPDHSRAIASTIISRTREMVGRYLRNESVPTDLSSAQEEYQDAWQRLQEKIEHDWEVLADRAAPESQRDADSPEIGM